MTKAETYASVWDAIAETPLEAANLRTRAEIMRQVAAIIRARRWKQAEAASRCGVSQPRINDLLRGRLSRFSLDALVNIATALGCRLRVEAESPGGVGAAHDRNVTFGYPEFWNRAYTAFGSAFATIAKLEPLESAIFAAAEAKLNELADRLPAAAAGPDRVEEVVYRLVRATCVGICDVVTLCGNGHGPGAVKLSRGMFESSVSAEYLKRNPSETQDYLDFGHVLMWRRVQQWLEKNSPSESNGLSADEVKQAQSEFNRVKAKFADSKGRVRDRWSVKSIRTMAREIGRGDQYELPYSLASSIHHSNAEGLLAYVTQGHGGHVPDAPPSLAWVDKALISAHTYSLQALRTLNERYLLAFDDRIKAAEDEFRSAWQGVPRAGCCESPPEPPAK